MFFFTLKVSCNEKSHLKLILLITAGEANRVKQPSQPYQGHVWLDWVVLLGAADDSHAANGTQQITNLHQSPVTSIKLHHIAHTHRYQCHKLALMHYFMGNSWKCDKCDETLCPPPQICLGSIPPPSKLQTMGRGWKHNLLVVKYV